jgi:hypothetical protein
LRVFDSFTRAIASIVRPRRLDDSGRVSWEAIAIASMAHAIDVLTRASASLALVLASVVRVMGRQRRSALGMNGWVADGLTRNACTDGVLLSFETEALRAAGSPAWKTRKEPREAALFVSYSLLSEYQVQRQNRPNMIAFPGAEVVWNEASLLWF